LQTCLQTASHLACQKIPAFYDTTLLKLEAADFFETLVVIYEITS